MFILFGNIPKQKSSVNLMLAAVILSVNIFTLISERQHYRIFYASPYENIVSDYVVASQKYSNVVPVIDSHKRITSYYLEKHQADSVFTWFDSFKNEAAFIGFLKEYSAKSDYLYFGALSSNMPNSVPIIKRFFPVVVMQQNYYGGTTWLFKKNGPAEEKYITKLGFNTPVPEGWQSVHNEKIITSEGAGDDHSYLLDSLTEWSPTFSVPLGNILSHHNNFIDVATDVKTAHDNTEALLVATLEKNGEVLFFSGTDFKSFYEPGLYPDGWFSVHHSVKLADINLHHTDLWLNVFVWNKSKDNIIIDNLSVTVREGNPLLYGLYEKLPSR